MQNPSKTLSHSNNESAHPSPHLRRADEKSIKLDGTWNFAFDDERRHETPQTITSWPLRIEVPFAPETSKSGIGDTGFHPRCWYRREFAPPSGEGNVLLHFGAVDYTCEVWINDHYAGSHEGGYTPFTFDITAFLRPDGPQTIAVRVDDDPHDLAKPRGKQDWKLEPHSIWYPRTTGIWQTVWAERVPTTRLDRLRWTPLLERWEIGFEAFILGDDGKDELELRVSLSLDKQLLADDRYRVVGGEVHRRIAFSDPGIDDFRNELLWSPEKPTLIRAHLELRRGGTVIDEIFSYTALRCVALQRDKFTLNGRPYYLRLVLDQGYWPDSMLTPPSDEAIREDIRLVKAMGFNGVRKHQKIEDPRFLYWADVMGLLVWEEMPSAYRNTYESVARIAREWIQVIDRDYNHPCIVTWVPFNESWGVPDLPAKAAHRHCVQALYHLTKTLDVSRPVIGNDGWESTATDIVGIHDYDGDPKRLADRYGRDVNLTEMFHNKWPGGRMLMLEGHPHEGQPIMLTEFGGIALMRSGSAENGWGYSLSGSAEDFKKRYRALLDAVNGSEIFSGFCYTQLTDTFQEVNGLLFADRTPKIPLAAIFAATRGDQYVEKELPTETHEALQPRMDV